MRCAESTGSRYAGAEWIRLSEHSRAHLASIEAGEEGRTLCGRRIVVEMSRRNTGVCVVCDSRAVELGEER